MTIPTIVLIAGVVLNALMAGLYFAFTTAVMPGLARTDDRSYLAAMQQINASILNPRFLAAFLGALVVPVVAVLMHLGDDGRERLPWIIAGALLYGVTLVITGTFNVPLNNRLAAAATVTDQSAATVRAMFHGRWTRFNMARMLLCLAAVSSLAVALSRPLG
jgi:uncharacterized membrane protein